MKNRERFGTYILLITSVVCFGVMNTVYSTINFHNRSSIFAMKPSNSVLRVNSASKVIGWNLESIVRDFGNNASSSWVETYTNGVVVSTGGGAARTNLLYATSNAVNANAQLIRVTSNALLYLIKNESNSNLRMFVNNSNTILYCCNNNSNAIILLSSIVNEGQNLIIPGPTYTLMKNFVVSVDSTVSVTGNTILTGNGHAFDFTKQGGNFSISAGKSLVLTDVVLRNFAADSISLGMGANVIFGEGTCIELENMQSLATNMTFSGATLIQGFGNKIMMNNAVISVLPGGRLTLQDLFIEGLKQFNIRAQGDSASVKFKNTLLCASNNYSFTSGRVLFEMDVRIEGTNTFGYRPTNAGSKILPCSRLILDPGLTFSYAPVAANRDLLGMSDRSSVLYLNGCSLQSTITGLRLTNGTLVVDHKNKFFNAGATSPSQAIAFGNGTAANDLAIEMMPGGRIQVQSGQLAYQNTN